MSNFPFRRILVIGVTGCGKSTLAERLAKRLDLKYIELDALHWGPGWSEPDPDEFHARVDLATQASAWVVAGNYGKVRDILWQRAEAAIWLDYPFLLVFGRLWRRTWQRWRSQELLWGTNREKLFPQLRLWSKESLFNWLARTYWRWKREYPELFSQPEYAHLKLFRFRHPRDAETWEAGLDRA